jgi:two-component sensor histidine kinase
MGSVWSSWFEPSAFSPHGFCLAWEPGLLWLHIVSDGLIALAYFSIPLAILTFMRGRPDFTHRGVAWLFAGFILFCGATHLFAIWTLWQPLYWLEGALKAATAVISVATAIVLWPLLPKALALPSPGALRAANGALQLRVAERDALVARLERREAELVELTATLEQRVAERTASLVAANQRFQTALAASGVTVFTQDARLAYTYMSKGELGRSPKEFLGRTDAEVIPEPPLSALHAFKSKVLHSGEGGRAEFQAHGQWFEVTAEPLPDGQGIICGAIEITRRKADEQRIRFLLHEVKHRAGNLLAVAQALVSQSARHAQSVAELMDGAGPRLQSLARTQRMLLTEPEGQVTIQAVLGAQLPPFGASPAPCYRITGPEVVLSPPAAMHLGMALHELTTNAARHGALSVAAGEVEIRWEVVGEECRFSWQEQGGPPVTAPERKRFGCEVIEWAAAQALGGQVTLDFPPEGLRWSLRFPLPA